MDRARERRLRCTVVAPDRTGLLATVAASLSLVGFDIESAIGYTHHDGMALEVFTGTDRFDRLVDAAGRARFTDDARGCAVGRARDRRAAERAHPALPAHSGGGVRPRRPHHRRPRSVVVRDGGRGPHARRRRPARARRRGVRRPRPRRVAGDRVDVGRPGRRRVLPARRLPAEVHRSAGRRLALRATLLARLTSQVTLD